MEAHLTGGYYRSELNPNKMNATPIRSSTEHKGENQVETSVICQVMNEGRNRVQPTSCTPGDIMMLMEKSTSFPSKKIGWIKGMHRMIQGEVYV
jgi:hypothetical protein